MRLELLPAVLGQHAAVLLVVGGAPGQPVPLQLGVVVLARRGLGDADGLVDHFRADAVAADDRDPKNRH